MYIICIELVRVFGEGLGIEDRFSWKGFLENWVFQGFLEAESARGKMTQHLSLFCGRLGTLGASGVQPWGVPCGSVLGPSALEAVDAQCQQAVTVLKLEEPV